MLRSYSALGACALVISASVGAANAKSVKDIVLHSFQGENEAIFPICDLIADSAGNLYGTTVGQPGGKNKFGDIYKLAPDGTETILHTFNGSKDGGNPLAGLIADSAGNLYGTASTGGFVDSGTVFKLSPDGSFTVLHTFNLDKGRDPAASLIADSAGNLYGTTEQGADGCGGGTGCGTIFKIAPDGTFTMLYAFSGTSDGSAPRARLLLDIAGNLYGTAYTGGKYSEGTVFKLAPSGTFTVLHAFRGGKRDGEHPGSGLIADSVGNLYGTTYFGGKSDQGTLFKVTPDGIETVLHAFKGSKDGASPQSNLIADAAGDLYGTAFSWGKYSAGTVFRLAPDGTFATLYAFGKSSDDGKQPDAGLLANGAGNLYGTTTSGGVGGGGTVFEIPAQQ